MQFRNTFALACLLAGTSLSAQTVEVTLNGLAVEGANDASGSPLGSGQLVLWLVDKTGSGFSDLLNNSGVNLNAGDNLAVGEMFGAYEIFAYESSPGFGEIDSDLSLDVETTPADAANEITAGDQFGVVWFPSLSFDVSESSAITTALNGAAFGFASTLSGGDEWSLPSFALPLIFDPSPTGSDQIQQVLAGGNADNTVSVPVIPEPALAGVFAGLAVWLVASRRR